VSMCGRRAGRAQRQISRLPVIAEFSGRGSESLRPRSAQNSQSLVRVNGYGQSAPQEPQRASGPQDQQHREPADREQRGEATHGLDSAIDPNRPVLDAAIQLDDFIPLLRTVGLQGPPARRQSREPGTHGSLRIVVTSRSSSVRVAFSSRGFSYRRRRNTHPAIIDNSAKTAVTPSAAAMRWVSQK